MNSAKLCSLLVSIGLVLVLYPGYSNAQPKEDAARAHYDRGKALADGGQYAAAYVEFEAGYKVDPRAAFLFNMGEAARGMGNSAKARSAYERYLAAEPAGPLADTARKRLALLGPAGTTASPPGSTRPPRDRVPAPVSGGPGGSTSPPRGAAPGSAVTASGSSTSPPRGASSGPVVPAGSSATPPPATAPAPHGSVPTAGVPPIPPHVRTSLQPEAEIRPTGALDLRATIPASSSSRPVWKRTWFWVGVGVATAAVVAGSVALTWPDACTSPGCIDLRN